MAGIVAAAQLGLAPLFLVRVGPGPRRPADSPLSLRPTDERPTDDVRAERSPGRFESPPPPVPGLPAGDSSVVREVGRDVRD
ncbi:MAG: hypothetical protein EDX89_21440 [Acidobacteria bacterium]|nr:MAG: hypothetical protein EDX89_21440 [Acidobacteriota bacterium]MCE7958879.1 hypothetical protein [Acidobacteria bacterium ACB2]